MSNVIALPGQPGRPETAGQSRNEGTGKIEASNRGRSTRQFADHEQPDHERGYSPTGSRVTKFLPELSPFWVNKIHPVVGVTQTRTAGILGTQTMMDAVGVEPTIPPSEISGHTEPEG